MRQGVHWTLPLGVNAVYTLQAGLEPPLSCPARSLVGGSFKIRGIRRFLVLAQSLNEPRWPALFEVGDRRFKHPKGKEYLP